MLQRVRFTGESPNNDYKTLRYCGIAWLGGKSSTKSHIETYLTFHLTVRASHLWVHSYTDYQQYLYDTIIDFREKRWNFKSLL
jgi:hypothetical protein